MSSFGPKSSAFIYAVGAAASVGVYHYINKRRQQPSVPTKEEAPKPPITMKYDEQITRCRQSYTMPFGGTICVEYEKPDACSRTKNKM